VFESNFLSTGSDTFDDLTRLVRDYHVGGFHVFGGTIPAPPVLLNPAYGTVILGQPFSTAFLTNRLQSLSTVPPLNTAISRPASGSASRVAQSFRGRWPWAPSMLEEAPDTIPG
jgi:hypothetical protein